MINRRELLRGGLVVTASLPAVAQAAAWAPATLAQRTLEPHLGSLYKVIVDRRFAEGREFSRDAGQLGAPVHLIDGDITDVWYHDLYPRWKQGAIGIAGLTAHGALFCLETLARDFRMRVVKREVHRPPLEGHTTLFSWVITP